MRFYFVNGETPEGVPYTTTLDAAKKLARATAEASTIDVEVEEVEVATDKAAILNLLNVGPGAHSSIGVVYKAKAKGGR
jgi:hypothetical protein